MLEELIEKNNLIINKTTDVEKKKKHLLIKKILDDNECFLKINVETAYALLRELDIPEEDIKRIYLELVNR